MIKTVLSLFDGMSGGQIALDKLGIHPEKYFASEIDKYAIRITQKNYPNTIQLGDVNNYDMWEFIPEFSWDKIDLLMGVSPCQDLSVAKQNRQGLAGKRSGLFWRFVEILEKAKPKYFLLENVASMKDSDRNIITQILGVEPIMINSALVCAQQRKRYYWTNLKFITQPNDKKIFLKDIVEYGVIGKEDYKHQYAFDKVRALDNKAGALCATMYKGIRSMEMTSIAIPCALRTRPNKLMPGTENKKVLELKHDGKANSLTTVQSDSMVAFNKPLQIGNIGTNAQAHRIYSVQGKSVTLNANGGGQGAKTGLYKINIPDGDYIIRKLTPLECERLQTVPEGYTEGVSNTQRYKMLGNGWTIDVIAHIFKSILLENLI